VRRSAPFLVGAAIVVAGVFAASAIMLSYVRHSALWVRLWEADGLDKAEPIAAMLAVLAAFVILIVLSIGLALAVVRRSSGRRYFVTFEREHEGSWRAFAPDVPGVGVSGYRSRDEARLSIRLAIERHLRDVRANGLPFPECSGEFIDVDPR